MPCPRFELHCRECGALVICPRGELDIACADRVGRARVFELAAARAVGR